MGYLRPTYKMNRSIKEQFGYSIEDSIKTEESVLAIQVGVDYFCYSIFHSENKQLQQLKRYTFSEIGIEVLNEVVERNTILESLFDKIIIQSDFEFSTLLPGEMSGGDITPMLFIENASQQDHVITEFVNNKEIANLYSIPFSVLNWLVQQFPAAGYIHGHSILINNADKNYANGLLRVDISENHFLVTAFKNDQVLLANKYDFKTPMDIVFYLLKICEVYRLTQEEVTLVISGLFSTDAKIYRAIYEYFLNINLKQVTWEDNITGCPAHYFTLLNEISECASFQEI